MVFTRKNVEMSVAGGEKSISLSMLVLFGDIWGYTEDCSLLYGKKFYRVYHLPSAKMFPGRPTTERETLELIEELEKLSLTNGDLILSEQKIVGKIYCRIVGGERA